LEAWRKDVLVSLRSSIEATSQVKESLPAPVRGLVEALPLDAIAERIRTLPLDATNLVATRYHGNLHLGQVLIAENDFALIDFEGHPSRPQRDWRRKHTPLHDVAGVLTSFSYAAYAAQTQMQLHKPEGGAAHASRIAQWHQAASAAFLEGYCESSRGLASVPADTASMLSMLTLCIVERALQELNHEMEHRPEWMQVSLDRLLSVASA
jgi:maltose alpha-D-glucosyltransferase/alpha-amylase